MDHPLVKYELLDQVAILTLSDPKRRNPLSRAMLLELNQSLAEAAGNPGVKAVLLCAEGPVFSAGHDLRELTGGDEAQCAAIINLCTEVMLAIRSLPKPVIAAVQGWATAAGCQLVATCDLVVAAEQAQFATPGVKIGLFCTTPGVALSRAIHPRKAMELLLTGQPIGAREAERLGLVNRVVAVEELMEAALALARQVISASSETLALGKRAYYEQLPLDLKDAYQVARLRMVENVMTPDAQEGMSAFLEKRAPKWRE